MIQMNRENSAIPYFQRTVALGEQERQAQQQEAQQEQTYRTAIEADLARRQAAQALAGTFARPQAAQPRPAAAGPAVATPQVPSQSSQSSQAPQEPVIENPESPQPSGSAYGGQPVIASSGVGPEPAPVVQPGPAPSTVPNNPPREAVQTPPAGAGPAASVTATPGGGGQPARGGISYDMSGGIDRLAQTPGTGADALRMVESQFQHDRQSALIDKQGRVEGQKLWIQALKDGDVAMAQEIGRQYGIPVPDEMYKNRGFMLDARLAANLAHNIPGLKDGEGGATFVDEFLKAKLAGADNSAAAQKAAAAARAIKPGQKAVYHGVDETGEFVGFDQSMKPMRSGVNARPTAAETRGERGDRPSATIQNRDDAGRRLKQAFPNLDDGMIQRLVMNPRFQITPNDITRQANALYTADRKSMRPRYKSAQEAMGDAQAIVQQAQKAAAGMEMSPFGEYTVPPPAAAPNAGAGGPAKPRRPLTAFEQ